MPPVQRQGLCQCFGPLHLDFPHGEGQDPKSCDALSGTNGSQRGQCGENPVRILVDGVHKSGIEGEKPLRGGVE
jgi:hypothetical protein